MTAVRDEHQDEKQSSWQHVKNMSMTLAGGIESLSSSVAVQQPQQGCPEEECKCWENSDGMESSPSNLQPRDFQSQRPVSWI